MDASTSGKQPPIQERLRTAKSEFRRAVMGNTPLATAIMEVVTKGRAARTTATAALPNFQCEPITHPPSKETGKQEAGILLRFPRYESEGGVGVTFELLDQLNVVEIDLSTGTVRAAKDLIRVLKDHYPSDRGTRENPGAAPLAEQNAAQAWLSAYYSIVRTCSPEIGIGPIGTFEPIEDLARMDTFNDGPKPPDRDLF